MRHAIMSYHGNRVADPSLTGKYQNRNAAIVKVKIRL